MHSLRTIRVTSSSPLSLASLRLELRLIVFDDDVKKTWRRSSPASSGLDLEWKCEACNSKTRHLQAQPPTPESNHDVASSSTCRRRPLQKGFLSAGKLTDTATAIAVDEEQLIRWAKTNRPKKWGRPTSLFRSWSSKSQRSEILHDLLQPTKIALRRSSSVAHLHARLDRGSKAWVNSQDLLPFAWFLLVDFSLVIAIDDATGHARSGAKKYRTRSRKKVSGRRFKTRSVGLVEAETFFCLAQTWFSFYNTRKQTNNNNNNNNNKKMENNVSPQGFFEVKLGWKGKREPFQPSFSSRSLVAKRFSILFVPCFSCIVKIELFHPYKMSYENMTSQISVNMSNA